MDNQNEVFSSAQIAALSAQRNASMDTVTFLAGKLAVTEGLLAEAMKKLEDVTAQHASLVKTLTPPAVPSLPTVEVAADPAVGVHDEAPATLQP